MRDAEKGEGDAEQQGPPSFILEVGGDAQAEDDDAKDEVGQDGRVYIHFLAPFLCVWGGVGLSRFLQSF